ncbi:MAG: hypothetical protein ACYTHN_11720 [Planctomycetota bacterium]
MQEDEIPAGGKGEGIGLLRWIWTWESVVDEPQASKRFNGPSFLRWVFEPQRLETIEPSPIGVDGSRRILPWFLQGERLEKEPPGDMNSSGGSFVRWVLAPEDLPRDRPESARARFSLLHTLFSRGVLDATAKTAGRKERNSKAGDKH